MIGLDYSEPDFPVVVSACCILGFAKPKGGGTLLTGWRKGLEDCLVILSSQVQGQ